jgi:hypothetical protein
MYFLSNYFCSIEKPYQLICPDDKKTNSGQVLNISAGSSYVQRFFLMYYVYMSSSCTYHAYKLTKFIEKSENIYTCSFHHTPSVYKILMSNS